MNSRLTLYMTLAVIAGFSIILLMNAITMLGIAPAKYIAASEVRGMAIEHNKLLYTLNFEQQNACVEIFNRAIPTTSATLKERTERSPSVSDIPKLIIYRFNAPDIEITPVAFVAKTHSLNDPSAARYNLVFSAPEWNAQGLLEEATQDQLQTLLAQAYDN